MLLQFHPNLENKSVLMNANRTNQFSYPSAFSRNIGQGTLNLSQQKKLKGAKIALVGLGGLGCAALSNLVRAGVENFWLCDFDVFEVSNLNRQAFATAKNLGDYKVDAAKEFVLSVNPGANVQTSRKKLDEKLAKSMCNWADVVLDCLDNPYPKVVLARAAKSAKKPLVFGSASGVYGMSCMFACDRNEEFKGKGSSTIANNVSDMEKILKLPSYGEGL
ncbi:hypothetical protein FJZ26_05680, partial [Candidatus Parvarchaeota archaeon]|nr:hypothetical protein [Candidatus Parvarchaeota archaeon]